MLLVAGLAACRETEDNPCFGAPAGALVDGMRCGPLDAGGASRPDATAPRPGPGPVDAGARDDAGVDASTVAMGDVDAAPDLEEDGGVPGDAAAPCACGADAPRCDGEECLPCGEDGDCARFTATPRCRPADGRCVECLNELTDCPDERPACAGDNRCAACTGDAYCASGVCDVSARLCVECQKTSDCRDPGRSRCDLDAATCVGCQTSADCAHLAGTGICDRGSCVQCTAVAEAPCGGTSCDARERACTSVNIGSLGPCERCVADSQCGGGALCAPLAFGATARPDGYCLPTVGSCVEPYLAGTLVVTTLSGEVDAMVCGVDETRTTCEAILAFGETCVSASQCTDTGLADARCEIVNGSATNRCTYDCGDSFGCPASAPCGGGYCGGAP